MNKIKGYTITAIAGIVNGRLTNADPGFVINQLLPDSRKILFPETSLFFALDGPRRNGKQFIPEVYEKGVRAFVVAGEDFDWAPFPGAAFIFVKDTLTALQNLAEFHRQKFSLPIIGITGSNGKTIVKEWLFQLLQQDHNIIRSPKSYNSQSGVPLSVWQLDNHHDLGIFEAGISKPGEMVKLQKIIRPTIGIFTNIGDAHDEGFKDHRHKIKEKIELFIDCKTVIYCKDYQILHEEMISLQNEHDGLELFGWSRSKQDALLFISKIEKQLHHTVIEYVHSGEEGMVAIDFTDDASIENSISSLAVLLQLGIAPLEISNRMKLLEPVEMRLIETRYQ